MITQLSQYYVYFETTKWWISPLRLTLTTRRTIPSLFALNIYITTNSKATANLYSMMINPPLTCSRSVSIDRRQHYRCWCIDLSTRNVLELGATVQTLGALCFDLSQLRRYDIYRIEMRDNFAAHRSDMIHGGGGIFFESVNQLFFQRRISLIHCYLEKKEEKTGGNGCSVAVVVRELSQLVEKFKDQFIGCTLKLERHWKFDCLLIWMQCSCRSNVSRQLYSSLSVYIIPWAAVFPQHYWTTEIKKLKSLSSLCTS